MKDIIIEKTVSRSLTEINKLMNIWEQSVKKTHLFLTDNDIKNLIPYVQIGLGKICNLIIARNTSGEPIGFIGEENCKIEMLFISPEHFNMGVGKALIDYAINEFGAKLVDVNEQNSQAHGFYQHIGFNVYDRSELDEQGNPFPILHMKLVRCTN